MNTAAPPEGVIQLRVDEESKAVHTLAEPEFDAVVQLAAHICRTPISAINVVDVSGVGIRACIGFPDPVTSLDASFCAEALTGSEFSVISDATSDERLAQHPMVVGEPRIRFYAGVPLVDPTAKMIGILSVMDTVPRHLSPVQRDALKNLGAVAVTLLLASSSATDVAPHDADSATQEALCGADAEEINEPVTDENGGADPTAETPVTDFPAMHGVERESWQFLQSTLDALPSQIAVLDHDGLIVALNSTWRTFSQENSGTAVVGEIGGLYVGAEYVELQDPSQEAWASQIPAVAQGVRDVIAGVQQQFCLEYASPHASRQRWYRICATHFNNEGLIRVVLAHDDITGQRLAATELLASKDELESRVVARTLEVTAANALLQSVMNHIPQAIFWKDLDSVYLGCNDNLAADAGLTSPSEIVGKNDLDMPWAEQVAHYQADDRQVMERDSPKLNIEEPLVKADGSTVWMNTKKIPLHDQGGKVYGVLCSYEDVTQRKRAEQAVHEAKSEAEVANQAKSEFLSRMSHELRTPLNAILGFGQMLEKQLVDPLAQESVGYILKGGRHLLDLINEVLDIARVEAGRTELSLEPIALGDIVPESCALMRPLAAARNIGLRENSVEIGQAFALADRQRLKQVLINLIANAIKYNRDGGGVEIDCDLRDNETCTITVRDTGLGMSAEDVGKLFTPFERLGASNSNIEGTGLGLVLSQRLVQAMGGTLTAHSVLGEGSSFVVALPLTHSPLGAVKEALVIPRNVNRLASGNLQKRVLCIEDNPSNLKLMELVFQARPAIELLTAIQGSVGIDLAQQHSLDLILLDLNLPDIPGNEVLQRLKSSESTRHIPIIVVSADATSKQIEKLLEAGAVGYLTKPLDLDVFLQKIDAMLASPGEATNNSPRS